MPSLPVVGTGLKKGQKSFSSCTSSSNALSRLFRSTRPVPSVCRTRARAPLPPGDASSALASVPSAVSGLARFACCSSSALPSAGRLSCKGRNNHATAASTRANRRAQLLLQGDGVAL